MVSTPVDVLAFGPHPDDIEIGMGATIAQHVARGLSVGICDLTRGEMGSNGTPEERLREAEEARAVLGAAWRVNLGLPDRQLRDVPEQVRPVVELIRAAQPKVIARARTGAIAIPITARPARSSRRPRSAAASGVTRRTAQPWKAEWLVYYFINNAAEPSFVIDVSEHYEVKQRALACHRSQFDPLGDGATPTG